MNEGQPVRGHSWKRSLGWAGGALGIVVVLGAVTVAVMGKRIANPEKFGEGVGQFACVAALIAYAASYLAQTGRKKAAWAVGAAIPLLIVVTVVAVVSLLSSANDTRLTPEERSPLVETTKAGARLLEHPVLGFTLEHPGDGFVDNSAAAAAGNGPSTHLWGYANLEQASAVMVALDKKPTTNKRQLRRYLQGMWRGLTKSLKKQGLDVGEVSITVDGAGTALTGEYKGAVAGRFETHARCKILTLTAKRTPYLGCVQVVATKIDARWRALLGSLK